jgi:hypothetical protein
MSAAALASISSGDLRPGFAACPQVRRMITRRLKIRNTGKFTTPIPLLRWHVNCLCLGGSGCSVTHPPAARAASNAPWEPCCGPADPDQRCAWACPSKRDKIRMPYVGQASGTWFSRAHALLKNRKTGARQICFLAAEVTTDQVRGILSPDKTECGSHVSSGRAAASPLRSPAFRDTTRQRFAG